MAQEVPEGEAKTNALERYTYVCRCVYLYRGERETRAYKPRRRKEGVEMTSSGRVVLRLYCLFILSIKPVRAVSCCMGYNINLAREFH